MRDPLGCGGLYHLSDHYFTPLELIGALTIGGAPAFLIALSSQVLYFRRLGLTQAGKRLRFIGLLALWTLLALPLTLALWAILPTTLFPDFLPDQTFLDVLLQVLLVPSSLASLLAAFLTCWLARRGRSAAAA
jgi:hypothetical protein